MLANRARLEYETGNSVEGETFLRRYSELLKFDLEAPPDRAVHQNASVASVVPLICRLVEVNELAEVSDWLDTAESAARALLSSPRVSPEWRFRAASCLGLVAVAREDSAGARECYEQLTEMLNPDLESKVVFCRGSLTFVQAQLARVACTAGILDRAVAHFELAERDCRAARNEPELAWICYDYANVLIKRSLPSDLDHAAALLSIGEVLASRYGMLPLSKKIAELKESSPGRPSHPGGLTPTEVEVIVLVVRGMTNSEIAEELFIAERTVSNHVSNILAKINRRNRTEAAAWARNHGLANEQNEGLLQAARNGDVIEVEAQLNAGVDVNARDMTRATALILAAGAGHIEIVQLLIDAGADANAKDSRGRTAFMRAEAKGWTEIAELLRNAGAKE